MNYKIIIDEREFDAFVATLPNLLFSEVWYVALFGRHKYDAAFPSSKDSGQLARVIARDKQDLKEKLLRLESPIGSFTRDGVVASQQCLAAYMTMNPRSLVKANKLLLVETAKKISDGILDFNPITLSTTCIHNATGHKFTVDFDFDMDVAAFDELLPQIDAVLPSRDMYRVLRTRGGFHVLVLLDKIKELKTKWYQTLTSLPGCDVRGSDMLTPIPGCTQGGFVPHFI